MTHKNIQHPWPVIAAGGALLNLPIKKTEKLIWHPRTVHFPAEKPSIICKAATALCFQTAEERK